MLIRRSPFAAALMVIATLALGDLALRDLALAADPPATPEVIELSAADQQHLQITTATLSRGEHVPQLQGYAQILDATQFITLVSDWQGATAAAQASNNEMKRLTLLQQDEDNASLKSVQAARALAVADQARARALSARIALEWSPVLTRTAASLAQRLSDGHTVLLRVEFAGNATLAIGSNLSLIAPGEADRHWTARIVGKASGTQLVGPGSAFLAEASAPELHVGRRLVASATAGTALTGSLLPAQAVVTFASQLWCFEKRDAGHFVRRPVPRDAISTAQGYLVAADFTLHPIVIHGASLLLSAERASSAPSQD